MHELTFAAVANVNGARADRWHNGFPKHDDGWMIADWSNAAAGEGGELAEAVLVLLLSTGLQSRLGNISSTVKKLRRIDTSIQKAQGKSRETLLSELATEIGDTYLYLDLLAQFCGLDVETCVKDTFNRVSIREGFPERIN